MLLVFCSATHGGLADYAHAQSEALAARGHRVLLLAPAGFPGHSQLYQRGLLPISTCGSGSFRCLQKLATAVTILRQQLALHRAIRATGVRQVLFTSYSEYLAPLWAWRLRRLRQRGVRFAAVVHDPVRNFVVGPRWWHRLSIAQGYSVLDVAFLHAPIQLDTAAHQPQLRKQLIPHGPFRYPDSLTSSLDLRQRLGIPPQATLLLSFGHIRNNKNLHLTLQVMANLPQIWLLVAGPEATAGQLPSSHYQQLAEKLGLAHRCFWQIGYQSSPQVADSFTACDAVLLTYASSFYSASGVMHLAAHYRKAVIASAGPSALLDAVQSFGLGVVVPPDNSAALEHGIRSFLTTKPMPDWHGYERANSWELNAQLVAQSLGLEAEFKPQDR